MTAQVEGFLDDLYDSDPVSHRLVNQAILVLERNGPAEGRLTRILEQPVCRKVERSIVVMAV
jgi:hypothetical protein